MNAETTISNFLNDSIIITCEKLDYRNEFNNLVLDVVSEGKVKVKFEKSFEYDSNSDEFLFSMDLAGIIRTVENRIGNQISKTTSREFMVEFRDRLEKGLERALVNKLYNKGLDVVNWATKLNGATGKLEIGIIVDNQY